MRPLSLYADCGAGYGIALVKDGEGAPFRAGVDLNSNDGTAAPRVILSDGRVVVVGSDFVSDYKKLFDSKALREEDRQVSCGELVPEDAPFMFRSGVEFGLSVSPEGLPRIPLRGWDGDVNVPSPLLASLGIEFHHHVSEKVELAAGLGVSYHGDTVVEPGNGLVVQDAKPDIQGFIDFSAYGIFAGAGVKDSLLGVEAAEGSDNFAVSKSYNHDYALPSLAMNAGGGYRNSYFELSLRYIADGSENPGFLSTLAVLPTDDLELRVSFLEGPEKNAADPEFRRLLGDFHLLYAGDVFGLMLDAVHGEGFSRERRIGWTSLLGALRIQPDGWPVGAFGRIEYFDDAGGSRFGLPVALVSATGGLALRLVDSHPVAKASHLVELRAEFRSDWDVTSEGSTDLLGPEGRTSSLGFLLFYNGEIPFYAAP